MRPGRLIGPAVVLAVLVGAAPASVAGLLSQTVSAASAVDPRSSPRPPADL